MIHKEIVTLADGRKVEEYGQINEADLTRQLSEARAEIARLRGNLESIKRAASQTGRIAIANMAIAALEASDDK